MTSEIDNQTISIAWILVLYDTIPFETINRLWWFAYNVTMTIGNEQMNVHTGNVIFTVSAENKRKEPKRKHRKPCWHFPWPDYVVFCVPESILLFTFNESCICGVLMLKTYEN